MCSCAGGGNYGGEDRALMCDFCCGKIRTTLLERCHKCGFVTSPDVPIVFSKTDVSEVLVTGKTARSLFHAVVQRIVRSRESVSCDLDGVQLFRLPSAKKFRRYIRTHPEYGIHIRDNKYVHGHQSHHVQRMLIRAGYSGLPVSRVIECDGMDDLLSLEKTKQVWITPDRTVAFWHENVVGRDNTR